MQFRFNPYSFFGSIGINKAIAICVCMYQLLGSCRYMALGSWASNCLTHLLKNDDLHGLEMPTFCQRA